MKPTASSNLISRYNNPSIQSILATSKIFASTEDSKQQDETTTKDNFKESFKITKQHLISIILSHIDELAKLVFEEPFSQASYQTLLSNTKIQKAMIKSKEFQKVALKIIKSGRHNTIGRLSEFIDQCILSFPEKIGQYFPFLSDLLKFCDISFSSTVFMFIDLINNNLDSESSEFWQEFLRDEKYFVLNRLDSQSNLYKLPFSLLYAIKNPITTGNLQFLVKLAQFPKNSHDLCHLSNEIAQFIEPLTYDDSNAHSSHHNEYKEIQVHAISFLTKMVEQNALDELRMDYEIIINHIIAVMKSFKHHNFALKACINFIIAAINSYEMKDKIISIIFPFFIEKIEEDDINNRFLIAFCKFCIDKINMIDETLTQSIPDSILQKCYNWRKIGQSETNLKLKMK